MRLGVFSCIDAVKLANRCERTDYEYSACQSASQFYGEQV